MRLLRERGYANVRHYPGGIAGWEEAGEPVERGDVLVTMTPSKRGAQAPTARDRADPGPDAYAPDGARSVRRTGGVVPVLGRTLTRARFRYPQRWADAMFDAVERRSIHDLVGIWLAMILTCGLIYWLGGLSAAHHLVANGERVGVNARGLATAIYFSFVTATSVGYGDVVPLGALRALAVVEAATVLLAFGVVVSRFVSRRQDELVREIHRTTFEERLDRVQTNLHLVLSELQTIAALCDAPATRPERLRARLESASMVFTGELRAVHALLYRPEHALEEMVLESILASLAASLHAFAEVLGCVPAEIAGSAILHGARRTMARLAEEICGECVPRAYAPGLKEWMDRVRETARTIA